MLPQYMHPSLTNPTPQSSLIQHSHSVSPSIMTTSSTGMKHKHSAHQSVSSLPANFVNSFMSTSDGSSCSQKWQNATGSVALLATSEELKDFNSTVKDLISSKEAHNRKEQQEQASFSEC